MKRFPGWIKRTDRDAAYVSASIRLRDGRKIAVVITDISSDGCKVSCRRILPIGEVVELAISGRASFQASVRWWVPGNAALHLLGVSGDLNPSRRDPGERMRLQARDIAAELP